MAKYQKYAEYKNVDNQWIDQIPSHWSMSALKHMLATPMTDGPHETPMFVDNGIPFVSAEAVSSGQIDFNKIRGFITAEDDKRFSQKYKPKLHDVYMIKSGATTGVTAIVETDKDFNIWSPLAAMRCKQSFEPYYLLNYLRSDPFQKSVQLSWTFGTQQNIGMSTLENLPVCIPPLVEQRKIASFLSYETAQIDSLIAKQEKLIELLKEKRQAVISHAVTKGLNPDVKMKDSGVEWLGQVPEHWGRSAIKNLCYVNDGNHGEEYPKEADFVEENEGVPFIRAGDFDNFQIISNNLRYLSHEKNNSMRKGRLQENDILFVNRGATIGKLCIIDKDYAGSNLNSQIAYLRANEHSVDYRYLTYFLSSAYIQTKIASDIQGGALPQYPIQNIVNLDIWFGDLKEQTMIADYLDHQVQSIICLINKCESAIQLMQERRTALISAAVTGKINVTNWQKTQEAHTV